MRCRRTGASLRASCLALGALYAVHALSPPPALSAQAVDVPLAGVVRSAGAPIDGAQVQLLERRSRVLTDEGGRFLFPAVPPGAYTLRVDRIGYAVLERRVTVGTEPLDLALELSAEAVPLAEIVVSPGHFGVMGERAVLQQQTITREDLQTVPQVSEDVFRGLGSIPGVAVDDISTKLNLRGGTDVELLTMLDGMELYEPYHLKDFDGVFGIVDVEAIGGIDLLTGGFPVQYGDKLTGVFDMRIRTPPASGMRTTVGLSVSNASVMSRGGFAEGRGRWLVQARRGYLDLLLKLSDSDDDDEELSPGYYDVFGKLSFDVAEGHAVGVHVLHAGDQVTFAAEEGRVDSDWSNSYAWLTWEAELGRVRSRTMPYLGALRRMRGGFIDDPDEISSPTDLEVDDRRNFDVAGVRQDLTVELDPRFLLKLGGEWKTARADYDYANASTRLVLLPSGDIGTRSDTVDVDLSPEGEEQSAYVAARVRPVDAVTAEVGVRWDQATHTDDSGFGPRVLAAWELGAATTLRASWGRYLQSHGIHELEVGDGEEAFYDGDRATQLAAGIDHRFSDALTVRVEAYRRNIHDQRPRFLNADREIDAFPEAEGDRIRIDPGEGRARGLELLVDRDRGDRWAWSVTYALSEAEDFIGSRWVPRTLDQRHALSLSATLRPNSPWRLSGRFQIHSGWPATASTFVVDTLPDGSLELARELGPLGALRLPVYHRLDLRGSRNWSVGRGVLQAYLDVFNAYNRKNPRAYAFFAQVRNGELAVFRERGDDFLPVLPTIGLRWEF